MDTKIKKKNPYSVVALTLGIISIFSAVYYYTSLPAGIMAIIFGNKGRKMYNSKVSLIGMIIGIIGVILASLILVYLIQTFISKASSNFFNYVT